MWNNESDFQIYQKNPNVGDNESLLIRALSDINPSKIRNSTMNDVLISLDGRYAVF
jgi:hypothetical protein